RAFRSAELSRLQQPCCCDTNGVSRGLCLRDIAVDDAIEHVERHTPAIKAGRMEVLDCKRLQLPGRNLVAALKNLQSLGYDVGVSARKLDVVSDRLAVLTDVDDEIPFVMRYGIDDTAFAQCDVHAVGVPVVDDRFVHGLKFRSRK